MSHKPNWEYGPALGETPTEDKVIKEYDDYYGHYKDNVADSRVKSDSPLPKQPAPITIKGA